MKILFLTPQLPFPPHKGTAIRNFYLIKNLARKHDVSLLSFHGDDCPNSGQSDLDAMRAVCAHVETVREPRRAGLARLVDIPVPDRPDLVRRLRSSALESRLRRFLDAGGLDLVHIEGLEMAELWRAATKGRAPSTLPKAILDEHNAEYVLQRRACEIDARRPGRWHAAFYSLLQWRKLARYERQFCRSVDGVVAASEHDRHALHALDPRLLVAVVPNGVDTESYSVEAGLAAAEPRVLFTGTMDFRPNVDGAQWLCAEVWPHVQARMPGATLWIVGRNPRPEVRRWHDGQRIFVTGKVTDVRPYLAAAWLSIVPLRIGGGSRLKVLESMAAGRPVVSTSLGCEGIAVSPETAVIADHPVALADAVSALLGDAESRRALASAARNLAVAQYDWRAIVPRLEQFHREVLTA